MFFFCPSVEMQQWNDKVCTLSASVVWSCAQNFTCTVGAYSRAAETHRHGSNAVSYGCPLKLGTVTTCAVLTQEKQTTKKKEKARVKTKTETESCQQTKAQCPQRGAVGRHLRQKKAQRMGSERWPWVYRLRQAWRSFPTLWGSPARPFF